MNGASLSGVLRAKQLHRSIGGGADGGDQYEPGASGLGRVDQVGVAVAVDCHQRVTGGLVEPVNGRHDSVDPHDGRSKALAVAQVAPDHRDLAADEMPGAGRISGENADLMPAAS